LLIIFQHTTATETFISISVKICTTLLRQYIHAIESKSVFHARAMPSLKKLHTLLPGNNQILKVSVSKITTDPYCN